MGNLLFLGGSKMFNDRVKVTLQSGNGGNGAISFRHEKYVEFGGPDGGNGGRGGSIYIYAKRGINSLIDYRFGKKIKADDGEKGKGKLMFGKDAEDLHLPVPIGTVILDENMKILADLKKEGDEYLAVKGGRGGRGNNCFKSPTHRIPRTAENGTPGETKVFYFELKLLADVGLVGLPSVGKSTFLSVVSNAKPKIADYEFTTLTPQLGVVKLDEDASFVLADLPGLIEGASKGKGLGFTFLRHIERCKVIIHMVDVSREEDPYEAFVKINKELESYNLNLLERKMVIALNKIDSVYDEAKVEEFKRKVGDKYKIFEISTLMQENIKPLLWECYRLVQSSPEISLYEDDINDSEEVVLGVQEKDKEIFNIIRDERGIYHIVGDRVVLAYKRINTDDDEGVMKLLSYLNKIGVDDRLHEMGVKDGSTVVLEDFEFDYYN